jgi:hypothetical protein
MLQGIKGYFEAYRPQQQIVQEPAVRELSYREAP